MRADLTLLQDIFSRAMLDIDQVDSAISTFKGNAAINRERFALYRGNILATWQKTCASAYPVLEQLLGVDFFNEVSRMVGLSAPSQSGNLTDFGATLGEFISSLDSCRDYPYLGDVAKLEWLVHRAYYLPYKPPVTLAEFAAIPAEQLSDICCMLQPSCALFASPWSVADIWHAHQADEVVFPDRLDQPSSCVIWRHDWRSSWRVQVDAISAASHAALTALQKGQTLGEALELALEIDPDFAVQSELADWLSRHLITAISTEAQTP